MEVDMVMELRSTVKSREWKRAVEIFNEDPEVQATKINRWRDTALHAAIETSSEDTVVEMIDAIINNQQRDNALKMLSLKNEAGNTPLHTAASRGSSLICSYILSVDKSLIRMRNKRGETPLFLAALHGHRDAFLFFHFAAGEESLCFWRRNINGNAILHCTINRERFDLSLIIIRCCQGISFLINEKGESPLAILASTPSAFITGIHFSWWEKLLFHFICVEKSEIPPTDGREEFSIIVEDRISEKLMMTKKNKSRRSSVVEKLVSTREDVFRFPGLVMYAEKINRRLLGLKIRKQLVKEDSWYDAFMDTDVRDMISTLDKEDRDEGSLALPQFAYPGTGNQKGCEELWTALLGATKNGATELVREILKRKPFAIDDETREKKNIVLVAIEARQSDILKELMKHPSWNEKRLKFGRDVDRNTALHLSARRSVNPSISLSVIHLLWELHWFEIYMNIHCPQYVKELIPAYFMNERNKEGKTPWMIFEAEHGGMLEESDKWVKETSGNYMVATTLISSVTFATCFQIPGGYDSSHGTPIVGCSSEFQLFAITALVSFCFSITSLAAFLAIYSSRSDQYRHYHRALPLKLLVGFFSLFVSIVFMLISFCAAHVFELNPKHKSKSIPLYLSLTSVPLCFYSATQIPLYWDLLIASLAPVPFSRPFYVGQQHQQQEAEEEEEDWRQIERKRQIRRITRRRRLI